MDSSWPWIPILASLLLFPLQAAPQTADAPQTISYALQPGESVKRVLPTGSVHSYRLFLTAGQSLQAELAERPKGFEFRVYDPAGVQLGDAWVSCAQNGRCSIPFYAEVEGEHRVELRSPAAEFPAFAAEFSDESYRLRVEAVVGDDAAAERTRRRDAISWLAASAHALRSVEAGSGSEDLLPLRQILQDVRIVGLGEGTHGTREFFQVKHRLLEFLVEEMGFTVFAMEIDQGAAKAINEFVLLGRGDRAELLAAQSMWQWDTEEVAAMLDWMREYNRAAPEGRRIRFAGFDFQVNDRGRDDVIAYLRQVTPQRLAAADSALAPLVRRPDPTRRAVVEFYTLSPEQKTATVTAVKELFEFLVANRKEFIARTSAEEFQEVLQSARRLVQFTDSHSRTGFEQDDPESGVATRDRYMAENIARLLDTAGPKGRMVVWGANEHIRRDPYNMGYYLGQRFGGGYYAFGLSFDRGGFRALEIAGKTPAPLKEFVIPAAYQGSVGWMLRRAGRGDAFVDFRGAPAAGPAAEWLGSPRPMRSIGNGYAPMNPHGYYRAPVVLGTSYDGIVFVEQTTPARGAVPPPD